MQAVAGTHSSCANLIESTSQRIDDGLGVSHSPREQPPWAANPGAADGDLWLFSMTKNWQKSACGMHKVDCSTDQATDSPRCHVVPLIKMIFGWGIFGQGLLLQNPMSKKQVEWIAANIIEMYGLLKELVQLIQLLYDYGQIKLLFDHLQLQNTMVKKWIGLTMENNCLGVSPVADIHQWPNVSQCIYELVVNVMKYKHIDNQNMCRLLGKLINMIFIKNTYSNHAYNQS